MITTALHFIVIFMVTLSYVDAFKVGVCPAFYGQPSWNAQHNLCRVDEDCIGNYKCCRTLAGTRCLLPETSMGTCPDGSVASVKCTQNRCPLGLICHHNWCCPNPAKSGRCPPAPSIVIGKPVDQCRTDANCELQRKCCPTTTGKKCLLPDLGQGICPDGSRSYERCPSRGTCRNGFFCSKNYCCPNKGSVADTTAQNCPVNKPAGYENGRFCLSKADCKANELCCKYGGMSKCYRVGVAPPQDDFGSHKGRCPSYSGEVISGATDTCFYDSDCDHNRKCCQTVSGRRCLIPE